MCHSGSEEHESLRNLATIRAHMTNILDVITGGMPLTLFHYGTVTTFSGRSITIPDTRVAGFVSTVLAAAIVKLHDGKIVWCCKYVPAVYCTRIVAKTYSTHTYPPATDVFSPNSAGAHTKVFWSQAHNVEDNIQKPTSPQRRQMTIKATAKTSAVEFVFCTEAGQKNANPSRHAHIYQSIPNERMPRLQSGRKIPPERIFIDILPHDWSIAPTAQLLSTTVCATSRRLHVHWPYLDFATRHNSQRPPSAQLSLQFGPQITLFGAPPSNPSQLMSPFSTAPNCHRVLQLHAHFE